LQNELTQSSALLQTNGHLAQVGWSRHPMLDCNLENAHFYSLRFLQRFRIKRWDYYAVFSPERFFSATIADLGYAGNIFVYTIDFGSGELIENSLIVPLGKGIFLPRNSTTGKSLFTNNRVSLQFSVLDDHRRLSVDWENFHNGENLKAEITLKTKPADESMNIVIPIGNNRFYYNRKINCMPASGKITFGNQTEFLEPETSIGSLDWGRGVWEYQSFWNWASASGYLPDGSTIGLNFGHGFGDLSQAGENAIILDNRIHKLDTVRFDYDQKDFMQPWHFSDNENRLDLKFIPIKERMAESNLGIITSEVHQLFGHYNGYAIADDGERIEIVNLLGFAEEHHARW